MNDFTLYTFRHAPVQATDLCYGHADVELRVSHEEAARRAVAEVRGIPLEVVWSSDLDRCAGPATRIAKALGVPLRVTPHLREIAMGEWESRAWSEIATSEPRAYRAFMEKWRSDAPPGGERLADFENRVRRWLREAEQGSTQLLVAHAGVVRALHVIIGGDDWTSAMNRAIPHLELALFPATNPEPGLEPR